MSLEMFSIETLSTVLLIGSAVLYAASALMAAGLFSREAVGRYAVCPAIVGWSANLAIAAVNWYANGYPPLASMYQVLSVIALLLPPAYLLCRRILEQRFEKPGRWLYPYFGFAAAASLVGAMVVRRGVVWSLAPALRSVWFAPHVACYSLSYALMAVSTALLIPAAFAGSGGKSGFSRYAAASADIARLAFPFMTAGLALGAVWAEEIWGAYWQWDIKEIWALITWLLYLCRLHSARKARYRALSAAFGIAAFAALIFTFFCLEPWMGDSLHVYA